MGGEQGKGVCVEAGEGGGGEALLAVGLCDIARSNGKTWALQKEQGG